MAPRRQTRPRLQPREPRASRPEMPGYGLLGPRQGRGLLPWRWAVDRLTKSHNYWLATVRPDGRPHAVPVWGVWLAGRFFFSTGAKSRKARNLRANPRCVVCTARADEAVIVEGVVERVAAKDRQLGEVFVRYKAKYDWALDGSEEPIYAVRPRKVFGFVEHADDFAGVATRWTFDA